MVPDSPCPEPTPKRTEYLLESAREGSDAAWRDLFERYKRMLLVTIECRLQGTLRRRFDAEDVLQDAFAKAWAKIDSFEYDGEGSLRRWLKKIVFHEFYNLLRAAEVDRRSASPELEKDRAIEGALSPASHPSKLISELESQNEVLRNMAELPEEEQDLLSMRIFEKRDWSEIAEVFDCNRVTARQRFDRTIANLARRMS